MKPMTERKMDMRNGKPKSAPFFPEEAENRVLPHVGQIREFKYPDTDELVLKDQRQFVTEASKNAPKPDFRH
jgi:hypothetical protein